MKAAKEAGEIKRYRALRGLLKVIKGAGAEIWLFIDFLIEELKNPNISGCGAVTA